MAIWRITFRHERVLRSSGKVTTILYASVRRDMEVYAASVGVHTAIADVVRDAVRRARTAERARRRSRALAAAPGIRRVFVVAALVSRGPGTARHNNLAHIEAPTAEDARRIRRNALHAAGHVVHRTAVV